MNNDYLNFHLNRFVHDAPQYGPNEDDYEDYEVKDVVEEVKPAQEEMFKVPDIFSEVTSSSEGYHGDVTSRDLVKSHDHATHSLGSSSWSEDNVHIIMPEVLDINSRYAPGSIKVIKNLYYT